MGNTEGTEMKPYTRGEKIIGIIAVALTCCIAVYPLSTIEKDGWASILISIPLFAITAWSVRMNITPWWGK
jgi:hypothetical protein